MTTDMQVQIGIEIPAPDYLVSVGNRLRAYRATPEQIRNIKINQQTPAGVVRRINRKDMYYVTLEQGEP